MSKFEPNKAYPNEEFYSSIEALEDKFEKYRDDINNYILDNVTKKLNDIREIPEVQVHVASQRQRLVDMSASLKTDLRRKSKQILHNRKKLFYLYRTKHNLGLNDTEINKHIDADLEHHVHYKMALENQIDFCKRSIETLDKVGFMIKYMIDQHKYLSGAF